MKDNGTEYEFKKPDGSTVYEIVFSNADIHSFQKMHGAISAKPVSLEPKEFTQADRDSLIKAGFTYDKNADNYILDIGPGMFAIVSDGYEFASDKFIIGSHNESDCIETRESDSIAEAIEIAKGFGA